MCLFLTGSLGTVVGTALGLNAVLDFRTKAPNLAAQPLPLPQGSSCGVMGCRVKLACMPPGPADVRFVWEKNGQELETCVPVQSHALPGGRAHVLSWLRDAVHESTEYRCSVLSSAGSQTSQVRVTVMDRGKRAPPRLQLSALGHELKRSVSLFTLCPQ